ncbi:MAG: pilus assembly protein [Burkholderiales bacterium]|nr:pilus assembly protein [Burkholderiales bacterium]
MLFFSAMPFTARLRESLPVAALHLFASVLLAVALAAIIFRVWYRPPYDALAGGRLLFLLLVGVDVVCGPLLTLLLYTRSKTRGQLLTDAIMIVALQATALAYGVSTAWNARPVYLVAEVDRFKVITWEEIRHADFSSLPPELKPGGWRFPAIVALRPPASIEEKNKVLFESLQTGRDYAERPEFYVPYNAETAAKVLARSREVTALLKVYPHHRPWLEAYARAHHHALSDVRYLPVRAREDWVAIVTPQGQIAQFLKGDGFL